LKASEDRLAELVSISRLNMRKHYGLTRHQMFGLEDCSRAEFYTWNLSG